MLRKILIIDDEADLRDFEKHRLEMQHYEVITASDGVEGLVMAKDAKPDLIVLDIVMPNLDGYSFLRELKIDPEIKMIPILILTSHDQMRDLLKLEGIHEENYLIKPFDGSKLVNRIEKILAN